MKVYVNYKMCAIIEGDNMEEIREKWESMDLTNNKELQYVGVVDVEDADTFNDVTDEFDEAY